MRNRSRATVGTLALSALMLGTVMGGPAHAATNATVMPAVEQSTAVAAKALEAQPGSLFYQVEQATSDAEKIQLLEEAGFTQTADVTDGLSYEKAEGGVTLGYAVTAPAVVGDGKQASADSRVGWDFRGPYMAATLDEWKRMAQNGTLLGGAGCVFITMTLGAAACVVVSGYISNRVSELDPGNNGGDCYAMYKGPGPSGVLFLPKPGAC